MNRTYIVAVAAAVLLVASVAAAEVQTREIEYKEGETVLQGLIAWDDASKGRRPGVLVVHEWWGHNEHARYQAKRLAEAGYVEAAGDASGAGGAGGRVEAVAEVLDELLQLVAASVPAEQRRAFLAAVRAFVADPGAVHAPLWQGLTLGDDGSIDRAAFLERLAALPAPSVQRLQPSGDRRALALGALRELLFFYLFALAAHVTREEDDFLASELKRRLATVDGPGG